MLSISIGPLALPVAPLVLLLSLWVAASLARRLAHTESATLAENALWTAALLGLLAARAGHILQFSDAYLAHPWSIPDLRDGGWWAPAGLIAGVMWLAWRCWTLPTLRRTLGLATLAGTAIWLAGSAAIFFAGGGVTRPPAPALVVTELKSGRTLKLPDVMAGHPAVVNLWASWCGPCRAEMPVLLAAQQSEHDIRFLFVNQGESAATVSAYLQRQGLFLEGVWLDPGSSLGPAVGSKGLPTTLFFNARGQQVDAHFGMINAAALQARIQALRQP